MYRRVKYDFVKELETIRETGLYKEERVISSDQKPEITVTCPRDSEPRELDPAVLEELKALGYVE